MEERGGKESKGKEGEGKGVWKLEGLSTGLFII